MDNALVLEGIYHEILMREAKGEEEKTWEQLRHEIMAEAIQASCNYYGSRNCTNDYEIEQER